MARTYNQTHSPRKYEKGHRRVTIYNSWSFPGEANRNTAEIDNRFSTITELRRVEWPNWEAPEWSSPNNFQQGIGGTLELFFRAWVPFQEVVTEVTGHQVPLFQRVDQAGYKLPLDERVLADTDTLFLFGLDHSFTEQTASAEEIEAMRAFLAREGTTLFIGPHHEIGLSTDREVQNMEYHHHGDALVPRQQLFANYTRTLLKALEVPVENRYGFRPAVIKGSRNEIAPFSAEREADVHGWLEGVTALNFHKHLPHYAVTDESAKYVHVLAKQPIDDSKPHPFLQAGNTEFNSLVRVAPEGKRAGEILFVDSTVFSTLFGASEGLKRFWKNLVK
jgi:hypothetical protein